MNGKLKYKFSVGHTQISKIDAEAGVFIPADYKLSQELVFQHEGKFFEPIKLGDIPSVMISFTLTAEQAEYIFGAFLQPTIIAKIPTSKGDLYAPVKSFDGNTLVLDIPENEDEAWHISEYWKQQLEQVRGE